MAKHHLPSARILIVEDDEVLLGYLTIALRGANSFDTLDVTGTTDSRRAVELWRRIEPDLIMLDLHMPHPDGFEVLARIRRAAGRELYLPVVAITGDHSNEIRLRALGFGAIDFISKPFNIAEAQVRIHNLLETRRLHLRLCNQNHALELMVHERTAQLEELGLITIERLALIAEFRDDVTGQHTARVGRSSAAVALELGLPDAEVNLIARAAPLHDVGKVGIPDRLLLKPGPLTTDEFEEIKAHTDIGAQILAGTGSPILELGRTVALYHHERWDGGGYRSLAGSAIPLAARIVSVTDVYDALTNARPYKQAWPAQRAIAEIRRQSGSQFDPDVVEAFFRVLEKYGPDSVALGRLVDPTLAA